MDRFTKQKTSKRGLLDFESDGNASPKSNSINKSYDNLNKMLGKPSLFSEKSKFPGLKRQSAINIPEDIDKDKVD